MMEPNQYVPNVKEATEAMRSGKSPAWRALRQAIVEHAMEPGDVFVLLRWPEDAFLDEGVALTRDGTLIEFGLSPRRPVEGGDARDVVLTKWNEVSASTSGVAETFAEYIEAARKLM